MVNKIISVMIMLVIGLALLPVVNEFATDLTGTGGSLENTTTGALVDLLPVIYVIILVAGAVGYIVTSRK
ncbi:MAG: hypothetical protein QXI16_01110 [Sulfolobaceae archaeon]